MSGILSGVIIIAILSILIVVHELGHYLMARRRGVRVLEFAIGMGPVLYKKQRTLPDGTEGTKFTIRALPIGGFCAFDDEEDCEPGDRKALLNATKTSRFLIFAAGSAMNLLLGILLAFVLVAPGERVGLPTIREVTPGSVFLEHADFGPGFTFEKIDGRTILRQQNVGLFLDMAEGRNIYITGKTADGRRVSLYGSFERRDFGEGHRRYGFSFETKEATLMDKAKLAVLTAADYCRLVWVTLGEIISGRMGADALAGPVGMGGIVNEVITAETAPLFNRVWFILDMMVLITLNLAILNLLPLPALDGGRIIFIIIEAVRRKPIPAKYEGWIHATGFAAFMALMVLVFYNDIVRLIR
jgi:regulator of sigma E protease